ncbi:hypothetical protein FJ365_00475 [Candidatus Dependentiae bacterium]|nr:hypothetical protein [Candidatus Dependentiae bacterium]
MYKHIFLVALLFSAEVDLRASEAISSEALISEEAKAALEAELAANNGLVQCVFTATGKSKLPDDILQKLELICQIYPDKWLEEPNLDRFRVLAPWAECIRDSVNTLPTLRKLQREIETYNFEGLNRLSTAVDEVLERLLPMQEIVFTDYFDYFYNAWSSLPVARRGWSDELKTWIETYRKIINDQLDKLKGLS